MIRRAAAALTALLWIVIAAGIVSPASSVAFEAKGRLDHAAPDGGGFLILRSSVPLTTWAHVGVRRACVFRSVGIGVRRNPPTGILSCPVTRLLAARPPAHVPHAGGSGDRADDPPLLA